MNNYLISIEYDGSNFVGWQRQKNSKNIKKEDKINWFRENRQRSPCNSPIC